MKEFFSKNKFWIGVAVGGTVCAWFASKHPEATQNGFSNMGKTVGNTVNTCKTGISKAVNYISDQIKKGKKV